MWFRARHTPNSESAHSIRYRPHIGGLRGLAVMAVVLYHARLLGVSGGYVGVDVFFVISGFLIASIIDRDMRAGTFSLPAFWERRIRRIVPALFAVMLFSIAAASVFVLYPPDYQYFARSVVAQSTFSSNMLFMQGDNYFDQPSRYAPLLHTWSLSVEEQFYILFPFIVVFCAWLSRLNKNQKKSGGAWNGRRIVLLSVAFIGVASFFLNVWLVNGAPGTLVGSTWLWGKMFSGTTFANAGFYLLFTRAWELALGIVAALVAVKIRSSTIAEAVSFFGVAAIATAAFILKDGTAYPGIAALLPTLGAAAIIISNEHYQTRAGKLLSSGALVWIGLISYSLYLWHWPLFVFAKLAIPFELSRVALALLSLASVALAWLSYKYIETPFRKKLIAKRSTVYISAFAAMSLLAVLGLLMQLYSNQRANRIPAAANNILLTSGANIPWGGECYQVRGDESGDQEICRIGDRTPYASRQFVVWGDSHADQLAPLFDALGKEAGAQGMVFDGAYCPPITGIYLTPPAAGCTEVSARALKYIKENDIRHIIMVARWSYYVMGGQRGMRTAFISDADGVSASAADARDVFERNFTPLVQELSRDGRHVYIVEQVPEQFNFNTRDAFYHAVHTGQGVTYQGVPATGNDTYQALPNSVIESLSVLPLVHIIRPASQLCAQNGLCALEIDGKLIYRDEDHLSTAGAMSMSPLFTEVFENIRRNR